MNIQRLSLPNISKARAKKDPITLPIPIKKLILASLLIRGKCRGLGPSSKGASLGAFGFIRIGILLIGT
jgi:hypothetical protein